MAIKRHMKPYVIEFEGEGVLLPTIAGKNKSNLKIKNATREGYQFDGWFVDPALTIKFDGKLKRGKTNILYAKWIKVESPESNKINVKDLAQNIVNNLLINKNKPEIKEAPVEDSVNVEENNEISENTNSSVDFINDIIKKATEETNGNSSEEELKNLIDRISRK